MVYCYFLVDADVIKIYGDITDLSSIFWYIKQLGRDMDRHGQDTIGQDMTIQDNSK